MTRTRASAKAAGAHPALLWKEAALQNAVVGLARALGWRHYHTHRSDRSPAGFPDLVLVHAGRGRVLYRELKTEKGRLSTAQTEWLDDLTAAGQDAGVWRPRHWITGAIEKELRT